jgi:hypothetical protein
MKQFILEYWMEAIFGGFVAAFSFALKKLHTQTTKNRQEYKCIHDGMVALLRSQIIQMYNHYVDKGEFPIYARETLYGLHKEYKALGGNGAVDDLIEILSELPTERRAG